jgi:hypothetical protein
LGDFARLLERLKEHSGKCFAAVAVLIFVIAGIPNFQAQLAVKSDPQFASDKAVGEFLRNNVPGQHIYYFSLKQTKPAVMFYSGRPVYSYDFYGLPRPEETFIAISSVPLHFTNKTTLFPAETEAVYQIQ